MIESADGNPTDPAPDRNLSDYPGKICWLAFCSGPALKREGRKIFPPSEVWMEYIAATNGFLDKTEVFEDDFGLPKAFPVTRKNSSLLFSMKPFCPRTFWVGISRWSFTWPSTDRMEPTRATLLLTAKGKVTSVTTGDGPQSLETAITASRTGIDRVKAAAAPAPYEPVTGAINKADWKALRKLAKPGMRANDYFRVWEKYPMRVGKAEPRSAEFLISARSEAMRHLHIRA